MLDTNDSASSIMDQSPPSRQILSMVLITNKPYETIAQYYDDIHMQDLQLKAAQPILSTLMNQDETEDSYTEQSDDESMSDHSCQSPQTLIMDLESIKHNTLLQTWIAIFKRHYLSDPTKFCWHSFPFPMHLLMISRIHTSSLVSISLPWVS